MDAFPKKRSESLVAVSHPGTWGPFEALMLQGRIIAFISYMEYTTTRIFHHEVKDWTLNGLHVDNFKRTVMECKRMNFFDPSVRWSRVAKKLKLIPPQEKKNPNQRLSFKLANMLIVKQLFSIVQSKTQHDAKEFRGTRSILVRQVCNASKFNICRATRDQISDFDCTKNFIAVDVMAWEDVRGLQDFRTHRQYTLPAYNLPPPTPKHEMKVPDMVRPEERRTRKRLRKNSPERPFIRPRDLEPGTFVQEPTQDPVPEPETTQDLVPQPESTQASQEDVLIFEDFMNIMQQDVWQETINDFLANFEREFCSMGSAHQINVETTPDLHQPPNVSVVLPPPQIITGGPMNRYLQCHLETICLMNHHRWT
ncbi:hypothetical protein HNY73_007502 [Argiope bruennichi]|uniref:Uncharacterized protein n=1 Tax=Argiope bruennichi TaxID=94029 RepID=A0A8T0FGQ0_ARGBR|nr:hypothetical protein HNY73_007502 [Argiope bruennichi]